MMKKKVLIVLLVVLLTGIGIFGWQKTAYLRIPDSVENDMVSITGYHSIHVDTEKLKVLTDEEVAAALEIRLSEDQIYKEIKDREIKEGDLVHIGFTGYLDGKVKLDEISAHVYDLEIGSNSFIKGFEDGLIGHRPGEQITLKLKFPKYYPNGDFAGHKVKFVVTIYFIKENYTEQTLTDDVVSHIEGIDSAKEYMKQVRSEALSEKEAGWKETFAEEMWKELVAKAEFKGIDAGKLEEAYENFDIAYDTYSEQLGITKEEYLQAYLHINEEEFSKLREETCEFEAKKAMLEELLVKNEEIQGESETEKLEKLNERLIRQLEK